MTFRTRLGVQRLESRDNPSDLIGLDDPYEPTDPIEPTDPYEPTEPIDPVGGDPFPEPTYPYGEPFPLPPP